MPELGFGVAIPTAGTPSSAYAVKGSRGLMSLVGLEIA